MGRMSFLGIVGVALLSLGRDAPAQGVVLLPTQPELAIQLGHSKSVTAVAFSPDGRYVITGSADGSAVLWAVDTGAEIRRFGSADPARIHGLQSVAFHPNGNYVLTAGGSSTSVIWDVRTAQDVHTFVGHTALAVAFRVDGQRFVSGGTDGTAIIWDVTTGSKLRTFVHAPGSAVTAVAYSPDGRWILTGGDDGRVVLWNAETGKKDIQFTGHKKVVRAVQFSPDGQYFLTAADESDVVVRETLSRSETVRISASLGFRTTDAAFSPDGRFLLTCSAAADNSARLWIVKGVSPRRLTYGDHIREYQCESCGFNVLAVAFSPDGHLVLTASDDGTAHLWETDTGIEVKRLESVGSSVNAAIFYPSGKNILTGSDDGISRLWNLETGSVVQQFSDETPTLALAVSADGASLMTGGYQGATLYDTQTGEKRRLDNRVDWVSSVSMSPKGETVLMPHGSPSLDDDLLSDTQGAELWELDTLAKSVHYDHRNVQDLWDRNGFVWDVQFSPDGRYVLTGSTSGVASLWTVDGSEIRIFGERSRRRRSDLSFIYDSVRTVAFSPGGAFILTGSRFGSAKLWAIGDGKTERQQFHGHTGSVVAAGFSPNGDRVVSGSLDRTARVWSAATGSELYRLDGHTDSVTAASFAVREDLVLTGSLDGTARLWSGKDGKELIRLMSFRDGTWVTAQPDGHFDTNNVERLKGMSWVFPDDPLRALAPETFMRDYYEPRLLPRLLGCDQQERTTSDACAKQFRPIRPLAKLNRIQPEVKILGVQRGRSADEALVEVEALGKKDPTQPNGKTATAVYALRLFRNGQLVGQWPAPEHGMAGPQDPKEWRRVSAVPTPTHIFPVRLATQDRGQQVTFTAYAFNEDRVKSETTPPTKYAVPQDMPAQSAKAYIITIGINGYENARRNLEFAVKDAEDMAFALRQIKDYQVVPVSLLSQTSKAGVTAPASQATKAKIHAVLGVLAGSSDRSALKEVANANQLEKATPDDLVILSFSGHGYTEEGGAFYLLPSDSGPEDATTPGSRKKFISSEELSEWLRDVDAGQMAMIIDACHSAASVDPGGFKPGPMGDRGLGQLAYDKGMRILAASQADNVALEIQNLRQGLLTYALVWEGLGPRQGGKLKADLNGDGTVTLEEWLQYAERRTPSLYDDAKTGKVKMVSRDSKTNPNFIDETTQRAQTPVLFDFHKGSVNITLQPREFRSIAMPEGTLGP